jgi:hypothetical protein
MARNFMFAIENRDSKKKNGYVVDIRFENIQLKNRCVERQICTRGKEKRNKLSKN